MAQNARAGSRRLQSLSPTERAEAINFIAEALVERQDELLRVNALDLAKVGLLMQCSIKSQDDNILLFH